ncbi:hypothetical protein HUG10_17685 [Halorarum halophilum]|uniref:Uncharacterized protein n=1 Tax=Halorarum halophilum TaxID=2743090 RepID=A0A7D5GHK4_9EURY|nr:hypothetical protein [Halobaculum halophilum]QLG29250.1 hypothetical protein HUG10_17685 [Halobaculum halophilum]
MTGSRTDCPSAEQAEPRHSFRTDPDELGSVCEPTTAFLRAAVDRSGADGVVVRLRG